MFAGMLICTTAMLLGGNKKPVNEHTSSHLEAATRVSKVNHEMLRLPTEAMPAR